MRKGGSSRSPQQVSLVSMFLGGRAGRPNSLIASGGGGGGDAVAVVVVAATAVVVAVV